MVISHKSDSKKRRGKIRDESPVSRHSDTSSLPSSPTSLSSPPPFSSSPILDDDDEIIGIPDSDHDRLRPEEEGEDLFDSDMENDYKELPHLDVYDIEELDDEEYSPLAPEVRAQAEDEMRIRDKEKFLDSKNNSLPGAFASFEEVFENEDVPYRSLVSKRHQRMFGRGHQDSQLDHVDDSEMMEMEEFDDATLERLKELDGYKLREELALQGYRLKFCKKFRSFLTTFVNQKGHSVYFEKIKNMAESNER
jgi:DNA replication licensing factor MCM2